MKPYNTAYAALAAAAIALAACSDDDKWTPGPADNDTGVNASFAIPEKTSYIFDINGDPAEMTIPATVTRLHTDAAATLPLALTADADGIQAPQSVTFDAGQASADITIQCGQIPDGKTITFTLALPADQTDTYGAGLTDLTLSVIKSEWSQISSNVRYLYSDTDYKPMFPATYATMLHLKGTYMFRLTDFFGSGLDITFTCDNPEETTFAPMDNADFESSAGEEDSPWYLYDDETGTWPEYVPGALEGYDPIQYLQFFATADYSPCYMIYDKDNYGYIALSTGVSFASGDFKWGNYQVDFNLDYNPFTK